MILPGIKIEKELLAVEDRIVIGVDEVGRGPLAGPVVAGAIWINPEILEKDFVGRDLIRDSKLLSEKQREKIFQIIQQDDNFVFGIGEVSPMIIDRVNILNATFLAMRFALEDLLDKIRSVDNAVEDKSLENMVVLLDGNRKIPKVDFKQRVFPRGDRHIFSIAAASICAKVYRDRLMDDYHKKYPQYGFDRHKGYGTALHFECLKKFGPCDIHRRSFAPVKEWLD